MRDADANKIIVAVIALVVGVGAVWVLYLASDALVSLLPDVMRETVRPFVFVGPGACNSRRIPGISDGAHDLAEFLRCEIRELRRAG